MGNSPRERNTLAVESRFLPLDVALGYLFPVAWLWTLPIWSGLGSQEKRHYTEEPIFSTAHPLVRQLPMQWLAGVVIVLFTASGMIVHFVFMSDWPGLLALGVGAAFVPALALAAGIWTGNSRLFEVVFVALWYVGTINHLPALDFMGATNTNSMLCIPLAYALAAAVLLSLAFIWKAAAAPGVSGSAFCDDTFYISSEKEKNQMQNRMYEETYGSSDVPQYKMPQRHHARRKVILVVIASIILLLLIGGSVFVVRLLNPTPVRTITETHIFNMATGG